MFYLLISIDTEFIIILSIELNFKRCQISNFFNCLRNKFKYELNFYVAKLK